MLKRVEQIEESNLENDGKKKGSKKGSKKRSKLNLKESQDTDLHQQYSNININQPDINTQDKYKPNYVNQELQDGQTPNTVNVVNNQMSPTNITLRKLGPYNAKLKCPYCKKDIETKIKDSCSCVTLCCYFFFYCMASCIICCFQDGTMCNSKECSSCCNDCRCVNCLDVDHFCPKCGNKVGFRDSFKDRFPKCANCCSC